ncbi:MAG: hypothetical protein AB8H79_01655 [Myxococcota bacterium]
MHTHEHDHLDLESEPTGPVDPRLHRLWRGQVAVGATVAAVALLAFPVWHATTVRRALRNIQGGDATLGLAIAIGVAAWCITATPQPKPAGPHRVGQWVVRALAALTMALSATAWWFGRGHIVTVVLDLLTYPVVLVLLGIGFAYVGRAHRLFGQRRMAQIADILGLATPLLWAGSQLLAGYPTVMLWGPGLAVLVLASACLTSLAFGALKARPPPA